MFSVSESKQKNSLDIILDDESLKKSIEVDSGEIFPDTRGNSTFVCEGMTVSGLPREHVEVAIESQKKGASISSSVLSLVNTTVGAGVLSLPLAFMKLGIVLGIVLAVLFAFFCWYSIFLLAKVADRLIEKELKKNKSKSETEIHVDFKWAAKQIAPWTGYANNFFIFIFAIGLMICYLIVVGDAFPTVIKNASNDDDAGWYKVLTTRQVWIGIIWIACLPLTFAKKLNSLRFVSYLAFPCMCYLAGYLFVTLIIDGPASNLSAVPTSVSGFSCISSFAFAYACHLNYYTVYNEYAPSDRSRYATKSGILASVIVCVIYLFSGLCGYLVCGDKTDGNVINSLSASAASAVARVTVGVSVALGFPMMFNPCRLSLMLCLEKFEFFKYMSPKQSKIVFIIVTIILDIIVLLALVIDSVDVVLNFLGCLAATMSSFIVPAYYYYKVFKDEKKVQARCAFVYMILGFVLMVVGFVLQVLSLSKVLD